MVKIKVKAFRHGESVGVTIPKEIRDPLGIDAGDDLLVDLATCENNEQAIVFQKKEKRKRRG